MLKCPTCSRKTYSAWFKKQFWSLYLWRWYMSVLCLNHIRKNALCYFTLVHTIYTQPWLDFLTCGLLGLFPTSGESFHQQHLWKYIYWEENGDVFLSHLLYFPKQPKRQNPTRMWYFCVSSSTYIVQGDLFFIYSFHVRSSLLNRPQLLYSSGRNYDKGFKEKSQGCSNRGDTTRGW